MKTRIKNKKKGIGQGFLYILPFAVGLEWFDTYSGLATSFIFIGNGLGTIFFNSLAAIYVNTENVSADKQYDEDHPNEK